MSEPAKQYTAFWPVMVVFGCFTITNILNLISNLEMRSNLETGVQQLAQNYNKAKAKEAALSGLAQDLIALAPTSQVAQQIVTDFHIQVKGQQGRTSPAPSAFAPAPSSTGAPTNAAAANNVPSP